MLDEDNGDNDDFEGDQCGISSVVAKAMMAAVVRENGDLR